MRYEPRPARYAFLTPNYPLYPSPMSENIRAESLTKRFGALSALEALSLTVSQGEIFGIVGPDGAGKTTTLRLLTSVMEPTSGDAWIMGHHVVEEASRVRENIGYMAQRFGLYPDLTVMENLNFYADLYGVSGQERKERIERLLGFSNLKPFQKRLAGHLSGGMKQKLGLACALIHRPKVLFLDEPTNGVDPVSRRDFWRILYQLLREGVTIVLSTAYLDEAERCSRVGLLHKGRLVALGTPQELKERLGGSVLEVLSPEPRRASRLLRQVLPLCPVGLFGDRVHLVTRDPPETAMRAVADALREAGIGAVETRLVEPSLEDVFVCVLSDDGRNEGGPRP